MNTCPFESDVLDALASNRWPARAGDDLRAHVAGCDTCASLATTAAALMSEHDTAYAEARVPQSAAVWHRAQLRAHEEAARAAMRPISFVQGVAFACGVALFLGVAAWGLPLLAGMLPGASQLFASFRATSMSIETPDAEGVALLSNSLVQIAIAGWLILGPIAAYFALSRD